MDIKHANEQLRAALSRLHSSHSGHSGKLRAPLAPPCNDDSGDRIEALSSLVESLAAHALILGERVEALERAEPERPQ